MKQVLMTLAKDVLSLTRKAFPLGSDNIARINQYPNHDKIVVLPGLFGDLTKRRQLDAILEISLAKLAFNNIEKFSNHRDFLQEEAFKKTGNFLSDDEEMIYRAERAHTFGAANCLDLALYALLMTIELGYEEKIELVRFKYYDHAFLVLNRPECSEESNWRSWGSNTLIIDPHMNKAFSSSKLAKVWKNRMSLFNVEPLVEQTIREKQAEKSSRNLFFGAEERVSLSQDELVDTIKEAFSAEPPENLLETVVELDGKVFRNHLKYTSK